TTSDPGPPTRCPYRSDATDVMTWKRGSTTLPAAQIPTVLVLPVLSLICGPAIASAALTVPGP
ncbi:MAG TPA: hypothetical protein VNB91_13055, partial [Jatrophihabitantaceae bacterium]|nr:hypothetical protein [Jatrophihabitantaceae bacterium]